jgi:hypothetical protein
MVLGLSSFKIVADIPTLHSRLWPFLKMGISLSFAALLLVKMSSKFNFQLHGND